MKNLPKKFYSRLENIYSKNEIETILNWLNTQKRKVSFRVNHLKSNALEIEEVLKQNNIDFTKKEFLNDSYILNSWREKDLWDLEIFKDWKIYMQSISSQIPVLFLDLKTWNRVLDVTSAPWSKTSQIADILNNSWEIIANDNNAIRIDKLKFTLNRQWVTNTQVIKSDARNLSKTLEKQSFDCILADLPCSAEWRINLNNEKSFWFWSEENILKNATLQKEILSDIVPLLKRDWVLVYSTCTLAIEENEEVVEFILNKFPNLKLEEVNLDYKFVKKWITNYGEKSFNTEITKTLRCLPSDETEWFYIAKFKKL